MVLDMRRVPSGFLLLFALHTSLAGQVVNGKVLEGTTQHPVMLAEVALLDTTLTVIDQTYSDQEGFFSLRSPEPGLFYIRGAAMGYRTKVDGIIELERGGVLPISFFLLPDPVPVGGVTATAERTRYDQFIAGQGFYDRRNSGFGHFISPDRIEVLHARYFRDLFRDFIGLRLIELPYGATKLEMGRGCSPAIWIDGSLIDLFWDRPTFPGMPDLRRGLEEAVSVEDIGAVEFYKGPASTPLRWSGTAAFQNNCGTMVIWTKGGDRPL